MGGELSGTEGRSLRLGGIEINVDPKGYDLGIAYQTQVENDGWLAIVNDGETSGTVGQGLRLGSHQNKSYRSR